MALTKPNQQLRRDLKEAAALLKWAGVDLLALTRRMLAAGDESGAIDLMAAVSSLDAKDKVAGYAEEAKGGRTTTRTAEHRK